jgi:hypothetical protein
MMNRSGLKNAARPNLCPLCGKPYCGSWAWLILTFPLQVLELCSACACRIYNETAPQREAEAARLLACLGERRAA